MSDVDPVKDVDGDETEGEFRWFVQISPVGGNSDRLQIEVDIAPERDLVVGIIHISSVQFFCQFITIKQYLMMSKIKSRKN